MNKVRCDIIWEKILNHQFFQGRRQLWKGNIFTVYYGKVGPLLELSVVRSYWRNIWAIGEKQTLKSIFTRNLWRGNGKFSSQVFQRREGWCWRIWRTATLLCSLFDSGHLSFSCTKVSATLLLMLLCYSFFVVAILQGNTGRSLSFRVTKTWRCNSVLPLISWYLKDLFMQNKSPHASVIWVGLAGTACLCSTWNQLE